MVDKTIDNIYNKFVDKDLYSFEKFKGLSREKLYELISMDLFTGDYGFERVILNTISENDRISSRYNVVKLFLEFMKELENKNKLICSDYEKIKNKKYSIDNSYQEKINKNMNKFYESFVNHDKFNFEQFSSLSKYDIINHSMNDLTTYIYRANRPYIMLNSLAFDDVICSLLNLINRWSTYYEKMNNQISQEIQENII